MTRRSKYVSALILSVAAAAASQAQTQIYQFSVPVSGGADISVRDPQAQASGPIISTAGGLATFNNFTETVYFDPAAGTLRQTGSVTLANPTINSVLHENQTVNGQTVSGDVTLSQQIAGGHFTFDTGVQPIQFNAATGSYNVFEDVQLHANVTGTYSLATGGQTYSGSLNYLLSYDLLGFRQLTVNGANSITLGQFNYGVGTSGCDGTTLAHILAGDGLNLDLTVGGQDGTSHAHWSYPGSVTLSLTPAPEPGTFALLGSGLVGLVCWKRRFAKK